jgi:tetratricopeptide (TPR) repeat protein
MRLREEGTAPASEIAAINLRCASMYWLGRSHMQQGAVTRALPLLRAVVQASPSSSDAEKAVSPLSSRDGLTELPVPDISIPGRNCSEFKMIALDHITEITKAQLDRFAAAIAAHYSPAPAAKPTKGAVPKATKTAADTASKLPSTSERVEAHERMAFVLSHLAKYEQAANHLHAAGMMLEGKWTGDGAAAAAAAAANYASSLPSTATRLRAIALYRAALRLFPSLERARYSLALSLVESQTDVDGGARMLRDLIAGSTDPQVKANAEAAIKLMQQAHSAQKAAATKKAKRAH